MNNKSSTYDSTELERVLDGFDAPIASSKLPRWQRKALQRQKDSLLNTPPKKISSSKSAKMSKKKSVSKSKNGLLRGLKKKKDQSVIDPSAGAIAAANSAVSTYVFKIRTHSLK